MKPIRRPFTVYLNDETKALFREYASKRDMDLSAWLLQAGLSYVRSAKKSEHKNAATTHYPSGWPRNIKCPECRKSHDPGDHGMIITPELIKETIEYQPGLIIKGK